MNMLSWAIARSRTTLCILLLIVIAGVVSRKAMVIEASPNPSVPVILVMLAQDGASPEDGARLLVRPIEKELRALEGLKEIRSVSRQTVSYVIVEFEADQDVEMALNEVRAAVDRGKSELPVNAEEPRVEEIVADQSPTIVVAISGDVLERELYQTAQLMKRRIEALPEVLEVEMNGQREEQVEIIIEPSKLEAYSITSAELFAAINGNNRLIPAGQIDNGYGRFSVKVPSVIETREDLLNLPIRADVNASVTLGDISRVRRTFEDPSSISTINGVQGITLNVKKRRDANDIVVTQKVRALGQTVRERIPEAVHIDYLLDQSDFSIGMIHEMQGNILTAMALVMVIIVAALGLRSGLLVGAGVPFSFLFAAIILKQLDYSFNFMVLFGMLLALGMLIDGAIVITEFADRKMAEGLNSRDAYLSAVGRMLWPVVASTATTLAAFLPILFWPGVAGEFMRYLPVTVFVVLLGSLLYALFFAPVVGALLGGNKMSAALRRQLQGIESDEPTSLGGISGIYARFLARTVHRPIAFFYGAIFVLVAVFMAYGQFGRGVEFFVETEQIMGEVTVRAQGNLALAEARAIVNEVEKRVRKVEGVKVVYGVISPGNPRQFGPREPEKDQIGVLLVETYKPEEMGFSTKRVYAHIREVTKDIPGIYVNAAAMEGGPPVGKPIQIQLTAADRGVLLSTTRDLRQKMQTEIPGLRDLTDTTPLPGIEWAIQVDKPRAAQMGVNVVEVGNAIQLVTSGIKIGEYRPDDADDEIDIRVRFPPDERSISGMDRLKVNTPHGPVALASFVRREAQALVDKVERIDGNEYTVLQADVEEGVIVDTKVKEIQAWLETFTLPPGIELSFRGANEEQEKSQAFLAVAFILALFLMFILLVTQFNSFYQALLTISAVVMSTAGVLLGLMISQSLFSIVMTGVGIVALAGIVVNNNIVLIDTFNYLRRSQPGVSVKTLAVMAATQRLRPVFLTTFTTILGLMPLACGLSIDLLERSVVPGGVVASFWVSLASAIVWGLVFSTILTLVVTPTMLILPFELRSAAANYLMPRLKTDLNSLRRKLHF